jgi:hypothetical protein
VARGLSLRALANLPHNEEVIMVGRRLIPGVFLTLMGVLCITMLAQAQTGRWKVDGNGGCFFDANDDGFDQCTPTSAPTTAGRWKDDGNGGCVFDASDSGPNQCTPPSPTESEVAPSEAAVGQPAEDSRHAEQDTHVTHER